MPAIAAACEACSGNRRAHRPTAAVQGLPGTRPYALLRRRIPHVPAAWLPLRTCHREPGLPHAVPCGNEARGPYRSPSAPAPNWRAARSENARRSSYFLRRSIQNSGNDFRHAIPVVRLFLEALPSGGGQRIVFGVAIVFRFAPFTLQQALMLQAIQRRIKRTLLNLQP